MHKCKLANKIRSNIIQFKIDEKEVLVENKKLHIFVLLFDKKWDIKEDISMKLNGDDKRCRGLIVVRLLIAS